MRQLIALIAALVLSAALGAAVAAGATSTAVQLVIDMRAEIKAGHFHPDTDRIGLRGAVPPLSWSRTLEAQASAVPGLYELRLEFRGPGAGPQPVPYKFKIERAGQPDAGWESGRNRVLVLDHPQGAFAQAVQRVERVFGDEPGAPAAQRVGHFDRLSPRPSAWVSPREVQVWLPPAYAEQPTRHYPVLYLHDGQNLFDALAAGAEWQVDETAQRLVESGQIAPMIIVGVASNDDRVLDYTPMARAAREAGPPGGGAPRYAQYLVHELKPEIDRRYRTLADRAHTAVGGSSLGGLVSMWLVVHQPETFGAALVVSPSVWWADQAILDLVRQQPWPTGLAAPRLWLDVGHREGERMVSGARALRAALQSRGWGVHYLEQPDGGHDELSWAARFEPMLRWLNGRPR